MTTGPAALIPVDQAPAIVIPPSIIELIPKYKKKQTGSKGSGMVSMG